MRGRSRSWCIVTSANCSVICGRYLGGAAIAEDAFQATFLQVHLKRDQFEAERSFRPWLYTIATHQAIDAQRRDRRHHLTSLNGIGSSNDDIESPIPLADSLVSREPDAAANAECDERSQWIGRAIGQLPEPLRATVLLVYYQGLKYREAAEVLGFPWER